MMIKPSKSSSNNSNRKPHCRLYGYIYRSVSVAKKTTNNVIFLSFFFFDYFFSSRLSPGFDMKMFTQKWDVSGCKSIRLTVDKKFTWRLLHSNNRRQKKKITRKKEQWLLELLTICHAINLHIQPFRKRQKSVRLHDQFIFVNAQHIHVPNFIPNWHWHFIELLVAQRASAVWGYWQLFASMEKYVKNTREHSHTNPTKFPCRNSVRWIFC